LIIVVIFILTVAFDQWTKHLIRSDMSLGQSIPVLGDFIRLTYVENPGIAFGIRVSQGWIFTVLSILASIGIIVYLVTQWKESVWIKSGLTLILGGAIGNLIDRIAYAKVVDFMDVGFGTVRWPVFNVADAAVVIGMFILFFTLYTQDRKEHQEVAEDA
jgi:signal peptidase II